jgi:hypothetical protein
MSNQLQSNGLERNSASYFRNLGLDQLSLTVSSGPLAATTPYRSLGFETFGYERGAIKIAQQYFDEEYMVLRLR